MPYLAALPSGPVVRTPCFHCRGAGSTPTGAQDPVACMPRGEAKKRVKMCEALRAVCGPQEVLGRPCDDCFPSVRLSSAPGVSACHVTHSHADSTSLPPPSLRETHFPNLDMCVCVCVCVWRHWGQRRGPSFGPSVDLALPPPKTASPTHPIPSSPLWL